MSSGAKPSSVPQSAIRNPQSADAWCAITVFTDEQWHALTAIEGLEALRRPEYDTLDGRKRHEAQIDAIIEGWTEHWERQELAAFLQARGVPAGPYQHLPEIVHADPVLGDAHFARVAHPSGREFLVHRNPIQAHRGPPVVSRGPLLGEHTFAVLHDLLGLNDSEIAEYSARGAVE